MSNKRYKKEYDYSYALGMTLVFELIKYRPLAVRAVYIHEAANKNESLSRLIGLCENANVPVKYENKIFNIVSPKENCYVLAEFDKFDCTLSADKPHVVLVSPMTGGNVGTVLRTALGLSYDNVALIAPCVDLFAPETVRASMGALFALNAKVYSSFDEYREKYPTHNLYPFMLTASKPIENVKFEPPYSLVLGNEAHGLPEEFARLGQSVIIPLSDKIDSFNLAVAAAIAMYEAKK